MKKHFTYKKHQLALIIPGHNEELVIEKTIHSAIAAGLSTAHIYVVSDNSSDKTAELAEAILGKSHDFCAGARPDERAIQLDDRLHVMLLRR